jgi:PPOX class probable F420-dependent enzyme
MDERLTRFLAGVSTGVLGTTRPDGTVRQSVVYFLSDGDALYISTEPDRQKARDIVRTGRASLCVIGHEPPYPSVTLDGAACLLSEGIGGVSARLFARISGGEPAPVSDADLAALGRVVIRIDVDHVYGASYLPAEAADAG